MKAILVLCALLGGCAFSRHQLIATEPCVELCDRLMGTQTLVTRENNVCYCAVPQRPTGTPGLAPEFDTLIITLKE